jgi:saccharopine dehydrogenase-like NADP-dependent oxidoreductase
MQCAANGQPCVRKKRAVELKLEEGQRDITLFRVEAIGSKYSVRRWQRRGMVGRYDQTVGFRSMVRATAFIEGIVPRMIAGGEIKAVGLFTPEQVITGPLLDRPFEGLTAANVHLQETREHV